MDERRRYNALRAVNKAQIPEGRPVNAVEVQRAYSEEGRAILESALIQDIKRLLSLGDVTAKIFRDAENVERLQEIAVTPNGHKFLYEMQNKSRFWLTENKRWVIGLLVTILLAALAAIPAYRALRAKTSSASSETHNVQSFNQSGGVTAHTVVVPSVPARHLTDELRVDLDREINVPEGANNPVVIEALLGNSEALQYAEEIKQYLVERGRQVEGVYPTLWAFPHHGIKILTRNTQIVIQVGSNE